MFRYLSEGAFFLALQKTPRKWTIMGGAEMIRMRTTSGYAHCPFSAVLGGTADEASCIAQEYGFKEHFVESVILSADYSCQEYTKSRAYSPSVRRALELACSVERKIEDDIPWD